MVCTAPMETLYFKMRLILFEITTRRIISQQNYFTFLLNSGILTRIYGSPLFLSNSVVRNFLGEINFLSQTLIEDQLLHE